MGSGAEGGGSDSTVAMEGAQSSPRPGGSSPGSAWPRSGAHAFAAGDRIGGRYRVLSFLARGAMGEVYAAQDDELGATVALKTLRSERSASTATLARFRREVRLARELAHPGICRIFDIGVHEWPGGRLLFLTMELLEGETLAHRLQRSGPLPLPAALTLAEKLASALGAAHGAGVVHRDLKPANIMLVADERATGGERVVITDFGLARRAESFGDGDSDEGDSGGDGGGSGGGSGGGRAMAAIERATATGTLLGSPAYMAPEQVTGRGVGPTADIYALGVVLFEAVTGRLPFEGETPMMVATSRLERDAPRARSLRADLDPRWDAVLARCLARDAGARFSRADEIPAALAEPVAAPAEPTGRRKLIALAAAAGLLVAGALASIIALTGRAGPDEAPASAPDSARRPPLLAVVPLRNLSGRAESAWLGTAVAEMLTTELGAGERMRVVPSDAVAAAARARGVALDDPDESRTAAIGAALAADYIVAGSVVAVGEASSPRVRVELRVREGSTGALVDQTGADGDERELFQIIARLGSRVRARLGQGELSPAEQSAATGSLPKNLEAARAFAEGIAALRRNEAQRARALFERAVSLEPDNPKYHAGLSSAWRALQFPERTRQSAERAFALASGLPRPERLFIEARHHEAARRFDRATELYAALVAFFPENIEYRLTLAEVQHAAGRPRDALATIDRLRAAGGVGADDPRVDVLESTAARQVSDNERAQRAALTARDKARALGAPATEAQAELALCEVLVGRDPDQARVACGRGAELSERLGDRASMARALIQTAYVRERQNARDEAARLRARARELYQEIGNLRGVGVAMNAEGNALKSEGKLDEALALQREALSRVREAGDDLTSGIVLMSIASTLVERGELEEARKAYVEVIDMERRVGNDRTVAIALQNLAWIEHDGGDVIAARRHAEEAMGMQERRGEELDLVYSLDCAGIMALEQDDIDAAENLFQRALAQREKLKVKKVATLQNLAELRLVQKRLGEAREVIAESLAETTGGLDEGFAREVELRILFEGGDLAGATRALARARELGGQRTRVILDIDEARILVARGQPRRAMALLGGALEHARKNGALGQRMEAETALGEAELAAGLKSGARRLAAVEREAAAHGFAHLAREAAELRARPARAR